MRWPSPAAIGTAVTLAWAVAMLPATLLAASPDPTPGVGGDPRSAGEGPGLVGDPLTAILVVGAIAVLSVVATLVYVRLTATRRQGGS